MRAARVAVFNLVFYTVTFFWAMYIVLILKWLDGPGLQRIIRRWTIWVQRWVRFMLGGRIAIEGRENIPEGPYVIAPKHQSELDVVVIFGEHTNAGAIVMQELSDLPFLGTIIRRLDLISVSVEGGPQGKTELIREGAQRVAAQGRPILIYPEGELMALGARGRWRSGVYNIYEAAGIPVVPVAQSLGAIWPKREWGKKPGHAGAIRYLEPIMPGLSREDFMHLIEKRVEEATMEMIRRDSDGEELEKAEARWREAKPNWPAPERLPDGGA